MGQHLIDAKGYNKTQYVDSWANDASPFKLESGVNGGGGLANAKSFRPQSNSDWCLASPKSFVYKQDQVGAHLLQVGMQ